MAEKKVVGKFKVYLNGSGPVVVEFNGTKTEIVPKMKEIAKQGLFDNHSLITPQTIKKIVFEEGT